MELHFHNNPNILTVFYTFKFCANSLRIDAEIQKYTLRRNRNFKK